MLQFLLAFLTGQDLCRGGLMGIGSAGRCRRRNGVLRLGAAVCVACAAMLVQFSTNFGLTSASAAEPPAATTGLIVSPPQAAVGHPRFPQSLLVGRQLDDGTQIDLTREAKFVSADPKIARVDERGWVWPVAAGQTTVEISAAGMTAKVAVTSLPLPNPAVLAPGTASPGPVNPLAISYQNEVQPILSKARCNQGACHGYSLGKNGFKLSLRGMDPEYDHVAITKEFFGRRIRRDDPRNSILLSKPAGDVPHVGGVRFRQKSDAYQRLEQWIREGADSDLGKNPQSVGIEVTPSYRVLPKPGSQQQLQVMAKYADGTSRDVTSLTIFSSGNEVLADVNEQGLVTMQGRGGVAIQVRYERVFVVANIVALDSAAGFAWANPPERNFIDKHVFSRLRDLRMNPADLASDAAFLRRVSLDLIGVQPAPGELRAFLADSTADKRDRAIEQLFARPEYVDHWSLKWGDLLQNSRRYMPEESMFAFRDWLRHAVSSNMPLDQFAREVLTGQGAVRDSATAAFYRVSTDPKISLERTAQVFTGIRMLCARCHPHPFENWGQADYYGLASFFNQVGEKADFANPLDKVIVVRKDTGFAVNPRTNQLQAPRFLGGGEPQVQPGADRRVVFAEWLTGKQNPWFARSLVNRYWSYFFSRGIIDPVDDIRVTNPPINAPLLDALTKDFVDHGFDVRHLLRSIVQSRTYQLSSVANPGNAHDNDNFSHMLPRRLSAEQLLDSVGVATGVPENIAGAPAGFRAAQTPDTNITNEFLDLFGRAPRMEACECERTTDSNMLQALHMINGQTLLQKVTAPNSRVAALVADAKLTPEQRIEEIYLCTVCRLPTPEEMKVSLGYLQNKPNPAEAYQDLMWALLNSNDFLFLN